MAKKILIVDDLDGSPIDEDSAGGTVRFSLNDKFYEIDLSEKNLTKLTKALDPFTSKATEVEPAPREPSRVASRGTTRRTQVPGKGRDYLDSVRRWARENGHEVSDRGRIATSIQEAYEAAHKS